MHARRDAIDGLLSRLPSTGKKTPTKIAIGALAGAVVCTALSARWVRRIVAGVAAALLLTQAARRQGFMAQAAVDDRTNRYGAVVILARNARGAVTAAERDVMAAREAPASDEDGDASVASA